MTTHYKYDKWDWAVVITWVLLLLMSLAIMGGIIFVIVHFVRMFW